MEFKYEPVEHTRWVNYRCRKCGGIIAIEEAATGWRTSIPGMVLGKKYHKHCPEMEDGEETFCDMISISKDFITNTVDKCGALRKIPVLYGTYDESGQRVE